MEPKRSTLLRTPPSSSLLSSASAISIDGKGQSKAGAEREGKGKKKKTRLYGLVYVPREGQSKSEEMTFPVVTSLYGGPHVMYGMDR